MPLHAQLRRALREIIDQYCVDGQKFYTEPALINRLGVSQSTVRRALMDLTRDGLLVRKVAKGSFVRKPKVGTVPLTINVFLPEWNSGFLTGMLEAISTECRAVGHGFRIHYTHRQDDLSRAVHLVQESPEHAGIILLSNDPRTTVRLYWAFNDPGYRVVNIDSLVPNYPGLFVDTSNEATVKLGLKHLCDLGHERIVFMVNEPEAHGNVIERTVLFEREAAKRGLKQARVFHCGIHFFEDSYLAAYSKMEEIMSVESAPTAIFAFSDPGAWAAIKWLAEHGIRVPDEVSVLGFSDDRPSRYTHPALTTIAHPVTELAREAVKMVTEPMVSPKSVVLDPMLVERESTAAPPDLTPGKLARSEVAAH